MNSTITNKFSIFQNTYNLLINLSFRAHIIISTLARLLLITYGVYQDGHAELQYTDIDYKVVTDGSRHMLAKRSPYERHTYRYSPILALLQIPNVLYHPAAGKLIYSCFDICVALLVYALVRNELQSQCQKAITLLRSKFGNLRTCTQIDYCGLDDRNRPEKIACVSACLWLYNPLAAVISTRGNGDSFSSFFVILTIYLLAKAEDKPERRYVLTFCGGLAHGFAIHLRLYPLLFSLAYYLSLSTHLSRTLREFLRQLIFPTLKQLCLVMGTLLSLLSISLYCYQLYGWQYIYEAYLYHFVRKDVRHNFSLYFLAQYLGSGFETTLSEKLMLIAPQLFLLCYISFGFGQFRQTLPFCVFALAYVIVTFNTVVTSQYFVWYMALLPLCLNNLQYVTWKRGIAYLLLWILGQAMWLLPAYLLEFKLWHTFNWIGAKSAIFFLINCYLLVELMLHYSFTSFKINYKKLF